MAMKMKTEIDTNGYEILTDGKTVWINSEVCLGRFSKAGVDVHKNLAGQMASDGQCLDCHHGLPFNESWDRFKRSMLIHHNVDIPDHFKPSL